MAERHVLPVREGGSIVPPEATLAMLELEVDGNLTLLERENGTLEITTAHHTTRRVHALVRPYIPGRRRQHRGGVFGKAARKGRM